jgi:hypothetical protein|nr:MAG TPA: Major tail protein [Caudoviricetes sp.]
MQIQPNSIIKLCSGVPIDSSYKDTIYFASRSAQKSYFDSKVSKTMDKASFQRINGQQGVVRMSASAESIYNCNYMMFQNSNYSTKWFYAFITNIEYVNDKVSNVYFTIDVMQTWFLFDCTLKESFVEREHHATDTTNDCLVGENIPTGQMMYDQPIKSGIFNDWCLIVVSGADEQGAISELQYNYNGMYSPCMLIYCDNDEHSLAEFIMSLDDKGKTDQIINIILTPKSIIKHLLTYGQPLKNKRPIYGLNQNDPLPFQINKPTNKVGSYVPKNHKLLCYPYTYLTLSNGSGNSIEYHYELFDDISGKCNFLVFSDVINGYYMASPLNYNGTSSAQTTSAGDSTINFDFSLTLDNMPVVPWSSDTFKVWWAQNKVSVQSNIATGLAKLTIGAGLSEVSPMLSMGSNLLQSQMTNPNTDIKLAGNGQFDINNIMRPTAQQTPNNNPMQSAIQTGMALSGYSDIKNSLIQMQQAKTLPVSSHAGCGNNIMLDTTFLDFYSMNTHVHPKLAKIIDDYFTMFGYATNEIKVPNINVRPHWTYTKTQQCNLVSINCSNNDITAIKNIFNNGITFWKNASEIGNYSLDNRPS